MTAAALPAARWPARPGGGRVGLADLLTWIFLGLGALVMLAPFLWLFTATLLPRAEAFSLPPRWLPGLDATLDSYRSLLSKPNVPMGRFFWNSTYIAATVTAGYVAATALAGYAFAQIRFPFKGPLFALLLVSLMTPVQTTIVPLFLLMRTLGLVDSHLAIILPGVTGAFAPGLSGVFGVFMMRQFFRTLPRELLDAARAEGAGHFRVFWMVALPLARQQMAALAVIVFTITWNDYFTPLVFLSAIDKMVLPTGIMAVRDPVSGNSSAPTEVIAAVALSILPVLAAFLVAQRWIVDSFVRAGVKG